MRNSTKLAGRLAKAASSFRSRKTRPNASGMEQSGGQQRARSAAVVLAVTLQRLIEDPEREWTVEETMVLDALRRSTGRLADATPRQLGDYLSGLGPNQFRGVVANVKGQYHELLVKAAENTDGDSVVAILPESTNQPGFDLEFVVDGELSRVVQLKAVSDPSHIFQHLERYPGIDIMATEEMAALIPGLESSGFKNAELEEDVRNAFAATYGSDVGEELIDGAASSLLVGAAFAANKALRSGKINQRDLRAALGDLGVGLGTALALEVILAGG